MQDILKVENLKVQFKVSPTLREMLPGAERRVVKAVDGVSFSIRKGEVVGLVGESGCGKSTVGKTLVALLPVKEGSVQFEGKEILLKENARAARRKIQYIFQDPYSSLNPRMNVKTILSRPMKIFRTVKSQEELEEKTARLMSEVGLLKEHALRFPHEFSGGQKQRISIARALACDPELIIADEPTAALDVSIQAQILKLLEQLRKERNLTMLFISHDLGVIEYISDRIMVMYLGKIVEVGPAREVIASPLHPYTKALLSAVPKNPLQERGERIRLKGNIPSAMNIPKGCRLHPRCPCATPECSSYDETMIKVGEERYVSCRLYQNNNS